MGVDCFHNKKMHFFTFLFVLFEELLCYDFPETEKRKQPREKLLSQDEETTITEEMDL